MSRCYHYYLSHSRVGQRLLFTPSSLFTRVSQVLHQLKRMTSEQKAIKLLSELFAVAISIKAGRNVKRSVQSCRKRWDQFIMIAGNINVLWSKRHRVRRPAIHRPILLQGLGNSSLGPSDKLWNVAFMCTLS